MIYNTATDQEINKALAEKIGVKGTHFARFKGRNIINGYLPLDYCNNWSGIGPLIEKYKIDIDWEGDLSFAQLPCGTGYCHINPKRAAAIAILMMVDK